MCFNTIRAKNISETQYFRQKASFMETSDIVHNQQDKITQLKAVNNEFLRERNYVNEGYNASVDTPRAFKASNRNSQGC
ncbi:hypothetical protein Bca52824_083639 [Brassica carinata]|uniref:Uncharacterized protein n=1 Tax=Brassica carinata TaxID=52824 RepID=A0A8X7PMR4_BRACI|nr:hypothetical protein Bca52824_083639 [Brassica carinata]